MKQFFIIANPDYFKKTMGWEMKHNDVRYTEDKLVMFVATDNVPDTNIVEPYHCGWHDTEMPTNIDIYNYNHYIQVAEHKREQVTYDQIKNFVLENK